MRRHLIILPILSVVLSGILIGCGGSPPEPIGPTGGTTQTTPAPAAPTAPGTPSTPSFSGAPSFSGGTVPTPTTSSSGKLSTETPDATVKAFLSAVENNDLGKVWDLLPKSYQDQINELFREFGEQVDAEMWDKSFNLLNRYTSAVLTKEDFLYRTPEMQEQFETLNITLSQMGHVEMDWLTLERYQKVASPLNRVMVTLMNCELSTAAKLKSFDGRVFFDKTIGSITDSYRKFIQAVIEEAEEIEEIKSNPEFQKMLSQFDTMSLTKNVKVTVKDQQETTAVVVIEAMGESSELTMVKVEEKWIPQSMAAMFGLSMGMAKAQIPALAMQVNSFKDRLLPALEEIEPYVQALQSAKTQEEFNVAYSEVNQQGPLIVSKALGMPGLSSMMGAGTVQVKPVTVEVMGDISEERLGKLIGQLEELSDDPLKAISLPRRSEGQVSIEITPVSNPQAFSEAINFAKSVEYDSASKTVMLELESESSPESSASETNPTEP